MSIYTRVHNQKKTADAWQALNPVLLDGEVIIVAVEGKLKLKVGDGVTAYNDLPFIDDDVRQALETKVSASWSAEDADKVLGVDENGKVVPVEALKGNLTWGEIKGTDEEVSTSYTDTLKLKMPGYDAPVDVQDFNDNFKVVDGMNSRVDKLINELTANPDYAATAEVVDMRTSYDGIVYDTAGQAVRALGADVEIIKDNLQTINPDDLGLEQDETTMLVYPTFKGVRSVNGIPLAGGSGGGVGATTIFKLRSLTDTMAFTVALGNEAKIAYTFSSVDADDGTPTGNGTASYYVNETLVLNKSIAQGDVEFDVSPYLAKGSNRVRVTVTDADGNNKSLIWDVSVIEISITSNFDYTLAYPGKITFKYTAYGDAKKTIHFLLDNVEQETMEVTSTGKQNTKAFDGLKHGLHTLEAYATAIINGSEVESNHLHYDVIVVEENAVSPIITINHNVKSVLQGELIDIPYIVYDPLATESNATLEISVLKDGKYELFHTEERAVPRSLQHWTTRKYPLGTVRFTVTLRDTSRSTIVNVGEFKLPIEPVTNDLELYLSAAGRSNNEINPAVWEYNGITTTFDNVNWASSGWINDANGDTALHLAGGSTATINFKPFDNDIRMYGKTLEFEFAVRDVNNRNANVISCMKDGVGFVITADKALMRSNLNSVECRYGDERKLRVSFVIESRSERQLMYVYLDGVMTSAFQYDQDDFQQKSPAENIVIGSPYCSVDLYAVRCYSNALSFSEVAENYICDIPNITERAELYDANDLYDDERNLVYDKVKEKIQVMTITGPLPQVKGDKKKNTRIDYYDPFDEEMCFENRLCTIDVQGTSSQFYSRKNYKLKFDEKFAHIKGAIPVKVYCMKADYAEATSTHNTGIANLAHTLYSEPIPPQLDDPRCRTTIEGFPCVIFHKETPESEPYFLGKLNLPK